MRKSQIPCGYWKLIGHVVNVGCVLIKLHLYPSSSPSCVHISLQVPPSYPAADGRDTGAQLLRYDPGWYTVHPHPHKINTFSQSRCFESAPPLHVPV